MMVAESKKPGGKVKKGFPIGQQRDPRGSKAIKQQDNDGDLRGPTANGLT